jgi:cytochrome c-type biogenesis protein CcmE
MKGAMNGETFECKEIVLKCPSKYTDEQGAGPGKLAEEPAVKTTE